MTWSVGSRRQVCMAANCCDCLCPKFSPSLIIRVLNECKLEGKLKLNWVVWICLLCHFHINQNTYETHDLTDHHATMGNFFLPAIGRKRYWFDKSQIDRDSSSRLAAAIVSLCALPGLFHWSNSFAKPPLRFSVCESGHTNSSGQVGFECSLCRSSGPSSRNSCNLSQWTDKYWIALGRLRAPSSSMNVSLVMPTRPSQSLPRRTGGPPLGPQCWKRSTLFHILESLWILHGFEETCWYSSDQFFSECQICTCSGTECRGNAALCLFPLHHTCTNPISPHIGSQISPVHSLKSAVSTTCRVPSRPLNCKTIPCGGQKQVPLVNNAPPPLLELCLHKFPLRTSGKVKFSFELPFCGRFKSIQWIVGRLSESHRLWVDACLNHIGYEMMAIHSWTLVERHCSAILQPIWSYAFARRLDTTPTGLVYIQRHHTESTPCSSGCVRRERGWRLGWWVAVSAYQSLW